MTLEDLLVICNSSVLIMKYNKDVYSNYSVLHFESETSALPEDYLSKELLSKEVEYIEATDNKRIKVWLKDKEGL